MLKLNNLMICLFAIFLHLGAAQAFDIEAGPIWSNNDAPNKCPAACASVGATWNGNWVTTIWGKMSVCGCENSNVNSCTSDTLKISDKTKDIGRYVDNYCGANKWSSYRKQLTKSPGKTNVEVTCCPSIEGQSSQISPELADLFEASGDSARLRRKLLNAKSDRQLVNVAKKAGYDIRPEDVQDAKDGMGFSGQHLRARSVGSSTGCGGFFQPECNECVSKITVYFPLNFCCIPMQSACERYEASCYNGYRKSDGKCVPTIQPKQVNAWMAGWDRQNNLPYPSDPFTLGYVTEFSASKRVIPADGLYIFVFNDENNRFLIRRSDRPDDNGCFGVKGDTRYKYSGNPNGPSWNGSTVSRPYDERPMFVRHTQLNSGDRDLWSAGQLQIHSGKIIWISSESGHYRPSIHSLKYAVDALESWNIAPVNSIVKFGFDKNPSKETSTYCPQFEGHDEL